MTKVEKLLNRFLENPQSLKFKKIEKLLLNIGFEKIRVRGSHHQYCYHSNKKSFLMTVPIHGKECRDKYKFETAKLIKHILTINKNDNEII